MFDWSGLIDKKKGLGETFQVPNLETGKMEKLITGDDAGALTANEEEQFRNMVNRLHTIFKYAKNQNVRVMVDAEQSYFQPAIHRLEHDTDESNMIDKQVSKVESPETEVRSPKSKFSD